MTGEDSKREAEIAAARARDAELARARSDMKPQAHKPAALEDLLRMADEAASDPVNQARLQREREAEAKRVAEYKERRWRDKVADAAPVRVARHAFDPNQTQAVACVLKWIASGCKHDLVLRGGVGTGKSTAAAVAVVQWVEPFIVTSSGELREDVSTMQPCVSWLRPDQLVSAIFHAYDDKAPKLRRYVVLDDLGRETRSEFVEAFCALLDSEGHTLLITTNMTKEEMREKYDLRVLDRLNDRAVAFDLKGDSMRKQTGGF